MRTNRERELSELLVQAER